MVGLSVANACVSRLAASHISSEKPVSNGDTLGAAAVALAAAASAAKCRHEAATAGAGRARIEPCPCCTTASSDERAPTRAYDRNAQRSMAS